MGEFKPLVLHLLLLVLVEENTAISDHCLLKIVVKLLILVHKSSKSDIFIPPKQLINRRRESQLVTLLLGETNFEVVRNYKGLIRQHRIE